MFTPTDFDAAQDMFLNLETSRKGLLGIFKDVHGILETRPDVAIYNQKLVALASKVAIAEQKAKAVDVLLNSATLQNPLQESIGVTLQNGVYEYASILQDLKNKLTILTTQMRFSGLFLDSYLDNTVKKLDVDIHELKSRNIFVPKYDLTRPSDVVLYFLSRAPQMIVTFLLMAFLSSGALIPTITSTTNLILSGSEAILGTIPVGNITVETSGLGGILKLLSTAIGVTSVLLLMIVLLQTILDTLFLSVPMLAESFPELAAKFGSRIQKPSEFYTRYIARNVITYSKDIVDAIATHDIHLNAEQSDLLLRAVAVLKNLGDSDILDYNQAVLLAQLDTLYYNVNQRA